ncbi:hypothetical protein CCZ01_01955 [Helicobacter monodelphidis]|uniref:hypothetical protein n=1 Tax=Helicobacter sp. 15-1451 TaxID=2004995 RepID=UPI000DCDBB07|nr:hypothetical protein [Helicobacter sp. 15-1451]RAX58571.1 hypothetical protein CCZ01_01955 [Helicobacter sp. 15-1451]
MRKKFLVTSAGFLLSMSVVYAATFEDNLVSLLSKTGHKVKVIDSKPLIDMDNLRLVNIEFSNKMGIQRVPFVATQEGKGVMILMPDLFYSSNQKNDILIKEMLSNIDTFNASQRSAKLNDFFLAMPKERFINLAATTKEGAKKTTIVVTSPECPFCRKELSSIDQRLKETNVKLVIVPLSGESSAIKSQLIINKTKNLKDNASIIAVLKEVYAESYEIPVSERNIDTSFVAKSAEMIFGTRLIQGVPYIHEMQ